MSELMVKLGIIDLDHIICKTTLALFKGSNVEVLKNMNHYSNFMYAHAYMNRQVKSEHFLVAREPRRDINNQLLGWVTVSDSVILSGYPWVILFQLISMFHDIRYPIM